MIEYEKLGELGHVLFSAAKDVLSAEEKEMAKIVYMEFEEIKVNEPTTGKYFVLTDKHLLVFDFAGDKIIRNKYARTSFSRIEKQYEFKRNPINDSGVFILKRAEFHGNFGEPVILNRPVVPYGKNQIDSFEEVVKLLDL